MTKETPSSEVEPYRLGVVILGAGASSRMGQPKLLLPWNGTTVIGHLIAQWRALGVTQIAVVCRGDDEPLARELDRSNLPRSDRIVNPHPDRGMFSSILCAAQWSGWQSGLTACSLVLGDQPHLREETLRQLISFHRAHSRSICQPEHSGRPRHPVVLPSGAFAELKTTRADTLKAFLESAASPKKTCPIDDPGLSLDLDRPEDYAKARALR